MKKSILLSKICLIILFLIIILADIFSFPLCKHFMTISRGENLTLVRLLHTLYSCSIFAIPAVVRIYRLLSDIEKGNVFTPLNVNRIRFTCYCLFAGFILTSVSAVYYMHFIFVSFACAFMTLIVHIVGNCFKKAVEMKDELDLTV